MLCSAAGVPKCLQSSRALCQLFPCLSVAQIPPAVFLVAWFLVFSGDCYFQLLDWVYTRPFLLALHLFSKTSASTQKIIFLWVLMEGKVQEVLSRWAAQWTLHEKSFGFNHPFPPRMPLVSRCWELIACLRIFFFYSDNLQGVVVCFWFLLIRACTSVLLGGCLRISVGEGGDCLWSDTFQFRGFLTNFFTSGWFFVTSVLTI